MSTLLRAFKQIQPWIDSVYQKLQSHDIQCYEPKPHPTSKHVYGEPVIQYHQKDKTARVVGVTTKPPGDIKYDKQTGITRSHTFFLNDSNVGHLNKLTESHVTDDFIQKITRITTNPSYDMPNLPKSNIYLRLANKKTRTLDDYITRRDTPVDTVLPDNDQRVSPRTF
jgi:hypothetical protein